MLKLSDQSVSGQILSDEHKPRFADLVHSPRPASIGRHQHMNSLEHNAVIKSREGNDTLVSHQVFCVRRDRVTEKGLQLCRIERPRACERERLDCVVVLVV
jgi:hypothetical protein